MRLPTYFDKHTNVLVYVRMYDYVHNYVHALCRWMLHKCVQMCILAQVYDACMPSHMRHEDGRKLNFLVSAHVSVNCL